MFIPIPFAGLFWPAVGVGAWTWLSLSNPHRELYGALTQQPFVAIVALTTLLSWLLLEQRRIRPSFAFLTYLVALFVILTIAWQNSDIPTISEKLFDRHWKTLLLVLLFYMCIDNKNRINMFVIVIVFSLAYWGVKGGLTFLVSAGQHQFGGPSQSMIGDRNNLAVALVMILPLILYLAKENGKYIYARWALYGVAGLTTLAVLGTYSRGGAIALLAVVALLAIRARRFVYGVAVAGLVVAGLIVATPPELVNRLSTIESAAEEDRSFQTRLISWYVYFQAGLDRPLTGVGPGAAQVYDVYFRYVPPESLFGFLPDRGFTAHSLYFELWGEYGVLGFLIYNGLILQMLWSLRRTRQLARTLADDHWAGELANALFIGIVGFCVGAAALSLAFYDGFLLMLALAAGLREVVEQERRDAGRVAPPARPGRGRARAPA